jgi:hypothetical protein
MMEFNNECIFVLDIDSSKFSERRLRYMVNKLQRLDQSKIVSVRNMAILLTLLAESYGEPENEEKLVYTQSS